VGWALESAAGRVPSGPPNECGAQQNFECAPDSGRWPPTPSPARAQGPGGFFAFGYAGRRPDGRDRGGEKFLNTNDGWSPAIDSGGGIRGRAPGCRGQPGLVEMSSWGGRDSVIPAEGGTAPPRSSKLRFTRPDGMRVTAVITRHGHGVVPWPARRPGNLRHRKKHARVGGRHPPKPRPPGCVNLPCHRSDAKTPHGGNFSLAANRLSGLAKLDRLQQTTPDLANAELDTSPLPVLACRRPPHPRRQQNPTTHRRHLGRWANASAKHGRRAARKPSTDTTQPPLNPAPEGNPPAWKRPPTERTTAGPVTTLLHNQARSQASTNNLHPAGTRRPRKN